MPEKFEPIPQVDYTDATKIVDYGVGSDEIARYNDGQLQKHIKNCTNEEERRQVLEYYNLKKTEKDDYKELVDAFLFSMFL